MVVTTIEELDIDHNNTTSLIGGGIASSSSSTAKRETIRSPPSVVTQEMKPTMMKSEQKSKDTKVAVMTKSRRNVQNYHYTT